jgi:hypothetical protein
MLLVTAAAGAQPSAAYRIESRSESVCAVDRQFAVELGARTPRVRPAVGDEPALRFAVEVAGSGAAWSGRLTVREVSGAVTVREVAGTSCMEIVSAVALIAAILVDPGASTDPIVAQAPPAAPSTPVPEPRRWGLGAGAGVGAESAPSPVAAVAVSGELVLRVDPELWI